MSRWTFETQAFRCKLECGQCQFVKANDERCRNRVCIGHPYCWIHNKGQYAVKVRDSTIAAAGRGLFATEDIKKGQWITPYFGETIPKTCLDQRYPGGEDSLAPYTVEYGAGGRTRYVDSACRRGIAGMANALFDENNNPLPKEDHNAVLLYRKYEKAKRGRSPVKHTRMLWLKATKAIPAGHEIFCHYGDDYKLNHNNDHETRRTRAPDTRPC